jgi:hypothetical protein
MEELRQEVQVGQGEFDAAEELSRRGAQDGVDLIQLRLERGQQRLVRRGVLVRHQRLQAWEEPRGLLEHLLV